MSSKVISERVPTCRKVALSARVAEDVVCGKSLKRSSSNRHWPITTRRQSPWGMRISSTRSSRLSSVVPVLHHPQSLRLDISIPSHDSRFCLCACCRRSRVHLPRFTFRWTHRTPSLCTQSIVTGLLTTRSLVDIRGTPYFTTFAVRLSQGWCLAQPSPVCGLSVSLRFAYSI